MYFSLKNEWFAHSLFFGERCEANRSGRSPKMSDVSEIAQVAHQKWAHEWIACFFEQIAHSFIFGQKTSDSLGKPMSEFPALLLPYALSYTVQ